MYFPFSLVTGKPQTSKKPWPSRWRGGGIIIPCVFIVKFWQLDAAKNALEEMVDVIRQMGMTDHLNIVTVSQYLQIMLNHSPMPF